MGYSYQFECGCGEGSSEDSKPCTKCGDDSNYQELTYCYACCLYFCEDEMDTLEQCIICTEELEES